MREITLEELLEAGCHFGHQVTRSNPKARNFIYEARDNIHIIDLDKTKQGLEDAAAFVKDLAGKGSSLLIVGTKRQAKGIVEEALLGAQGENAGEGLYYVTNRWVGGLLTNFSEVSKNFEKLKELTANLKNEEFKNKYTKKEIGQWAKERQKLESLYGGVATLTKMPDALFIIDSHLEELAAKEAMQKGVATVGIVDTNADPDVIDYPIPANDDAVGSIKLITSYIVDAWIEGRKNLESRIQSSESVKRAELREEGEAEKESAQATTSVSTKSKRAKSKRSKLKTNS